MSSQEINFSRRADRLKSSVIRELLALTQQPGVISFAGGLPAPNLMPEISIDHLPDALRQYGTTDGEASFREAVASLVGEEGLECGPESVLATSGSQQGIDLVAKLFVDEGTLVFVEKPAYLAALQVFGMYGAEIVGIEIQADGINLQDLHEKLETRRPAFLYINPTFQNPTGYCYSDVKRQQLAALMDQYNVPLIEDNPYGRLRYDGDAQMPVSSWLKTAPWVYLGSFSKVAVPAWRIGYLVSDSRLASHFAKIKQGTDLHTNRPGQWWCQEFINNKVGFSKHISELCEYYTEQRDAMERALVEHFSDIASWEKPQGGLFFWVKLNKNINAADILPKALEKQVAFVPGSAFYPDDDQELNCIRLSFSEASVANISIGVSRLGEVFRLAAG